MSEMLRSDVNAVVRAVLGSAVTVEGATEIGQGRGVFSSVVRVQLRGRGAPADSVVLKLPLRGPNGDAARASGAYRREALAYRQLLGGATPLRFPKWHGTHQLDTGPALVLEDLSDLVVVDQLDGLNVDQLLAAAQALARFHVHALHSIDLGTLEVRHHTPAAFAITDLRMGIDRVGPRHRSIFSAVVDRRDELVEGFCELPVPTLCHGDPRADNLVFDPDGEPVFFDWQQLAIQAGEADLAWLLATSATPQVRGRIEREVCARYAAVQKRPEDEVWERYRRAIVLPGSAVLLLVQREVTGDRARRMVDTSVERIAAALAEVLLD